MDKNKLSLTVFHSLEILYSYPEHLVLSCGFVWQNQAILVGRLTISQIKSILPGENLIQVYTELVSVVYSKPG